MPEIFSQQPGKGKVNYFIINKCFEIIKCKENIPIVEFVAVKQYTTGTC